MVAVTEILTVLTLCEATTGLSGSSGAIDTQFVKQGNGSYYYQTGKNSIESCTFTPASNVNMTASYTNPHLYWIMRCDVFTSCEPLNTGATNSGLMVKVEDGSGNYVQWHITGSDFWDGSVKSFVLDLTNTANIHSSSGTLSLADVDVITFITDNSNSGTIRIIDNTWLDAIRFGEGLQAESATTEAFDFLDIAGDDSLNANYYQVVQKAYGVIGIQGSVILGDASGSASCDFVSVNEQLVFQNQIVEASHYKISAVASGTATTDIDIKGAVWSSDEATKPDVDFSDPDLNSVSFQGTMLELGTFVFGSIVDAQNTTYVNCDQITPGGADMRGSVISGYEGTVDTSAVIHNPATDPDGLLDNMSITKGTAATHAVEFGTGSPLTMTLRGIDFSGYHASNGQTDSTFHVKRTSGTVTINIIGGSGNVSYKTDGATVVVVSNPVTFTATIQDPDGNLITDGTINIEVLAAAGGALSVGTEIIREATDSNGEVNDTRTYTQDQPVEGWARGDLADPNYRQTDIAGTISKDNGLSLVFKMILE